MKNRPKKRMSLVLKIIIGISAIPAALILFFVSALLLSPIIDSFDKPRFEKLDASSRALHEKLQDVAGDSNDWQYTASCIPEMSGWLETGAYYCTTRIQIDVEVESARQILALHEKYFPYIDESLDLKPVSQLDKQLPGHFGIKFTVSSAEKRYQSVHSDDIRCTYSAQLNQPLETAGKLYNQSYGADIATPKGRAMVSLECRDKAQRDWYEES